jgi:hypothetical protein
MDLVRLNATGSYPTLIRELADFHYDQFPAERLVELRRGLLDTGQHSFSHW